jgi:cytochrome bd-type quinol oxidase subunit 2
MAKKRTAAKKRVTRKPAHRQRTRSADATINTLVILVVIVMVLGGLFLYAQNKKQAALWPNLMQAVATLSGAAATVLPAVFQPAQTIQPAAGPEPARPAVAGAPPQQPGL